MTDQLIAFAEKEASRTTCRSCGHETCPNNLRAGRFNAIADALRELQALQLVDRIPEQEAWNSLETNRPMPGRLKQPRSIAALRGMLSTVCHFVWNRRLQPGEHLWTIPADPERDFDCMFSDAFDELEQLRAVRGPGMWVPLDEYEIANLRAAIEACGFPNGEHAGNPLAALNTGDWIGQIYWKLPKVSTAPNRTPEEIRKEALPRPAPPDQVLQHMVNRFLSWRLPDNFNPDGGISFKREFNEHTPYPMKHEPTGTNLFDATQAEAMVKHMLDGLEQRHQQPNSRP